MKKKISMIAAATLALSIMASTAMADTLKTTADYKDLTNVDSALKSKIDALLAKQVFEGVSSDSFGITQNMTRAQFAKVASLIFELPIDLTNQTSSFADVRVSDAANGWAIPYIEAAKKAGLIDGMTDTTFAPGENVTIGQLDTVLVKGLGKTVNTSSSPWYTDAVNQATSLSIHPGDKVGSAIATRSDLVVGAYGSSQAFNAAKTPTQGQGQGQNQSQGPAILSSKASGDQSIVVTLDQPVDTDLALWSINKEGAELSKTVSWSLDKKTAALKLSNTVLSPGSYIITLSGDGLSSIRTVSSTLAIGSSTASGTLNYEITGSYDLSNVIDSGITQAATGLSGYTTKADAENPVSSKFAKKITMNATNSSGEQIAIPGIIQSITSSDPSIVKAAVSSDHKGYILGNKAGTATVNIIYSTQNGENKQTAVSVQVKTDAVAGQKIEARKSSYTHTATVTGGVYYGLFNAYDKMDLKITDNYGIEYEQNEAQNYNFALNTFFNPEDIVGNPSNGSVGTVTVDTAGNVLVTGNVTRFTLVAILPNGNRAYTDVTVRSNQ
ncbi:S-layer homology domain-containing protein [Paenibacillus sp. WQ 127069]|uniref:S-layer homology domain-containing protein n=1 Tax=Paenibacillus baimaensis TaxID=2982185 RepID=A0ABT2ULJ7_9BACL|nr:S-layer homology domain-containing protein [Paenibacillus sp. WQ 127069]MCU6795520.1 S-layer homology domain-containing protein [Paenibacillus sp. WQ 127069]